MCVCVYKVHTQEIGQVYGDYDSHKCSRAHAREIAFRESSEVTYAQEGCFHLVYARVGLSLIPLGYGDGEFLALLHLLGKQLS